MVTVVFSLTRTRERSPYFLVTHLCTLPTGELLGTNSERDFCAPRSTSVAMRCREIHRSL